METRRLRSGFTAQLSYTYAKSIDNAAVGARNPLVPQNWLDLSAEALGNRLRTMPMKFQIGLDKLTPEEYTSRSNGARRPTPQSRASHANSFRRRLGYLHARYRA